MPNMVFSGSNDHTVRVWDMNALHGGDPRPGPELALGRGVELAAAAPGQLVLLQGGAWGFLA